MWLPKLGALVGFFQVLKLLDDCFLEWDLTLAATRFLLELPNNFTPFLELLCIMVREIKQHWDG